MKMMKRMVVVLAVALLSVMAPANLVPNGDFTEWSSGEPVGWSKWAGNWWQDGTDDVCVLGWSSGAVIGQDTGLVMLADTQYTLTARVQSRAEAGGQAEGLEVITQGLGWGNIVRTTYMFKDYGVVQGTSSDWLDFSVTFNTAAPEYASQVGSTLKVAIATVQPGTDFHQYGNLYIDSMTVVPEPATLVLLGLGALVSLKKRKA